MQTYLVMILFLLLYGIVVIFGIRPRKDDDVIFDVDDTNILKGLWCIVVILVHTPEGYQNVIQDMIGSFAYVGVTFFFMVSAYGLECGVNKKKGYLKNFWKRRLPKILVPMLVINVLSSLNGALVGGSRFRIAWLFRINGWVLVLMLFYIVFWCAHVLSDRFKIRGGVANSIVCAAVILYSIVSYSINFNTTVWPTESFGFIYGILFAHFIEDYANFVRKKWISKWISSLLVALMLGVAYLKFKPVLFFGDYLLKIILGIAITNVVLSFICRFKLGNKANRFLGKVSYEIYLLHGVVFYFLQLVMTELESEYFIILGIIITVAASVAVSFVNRFLIRGINKILYR